MGRLSTSSRYMIDITGPDSLSFEELARISRCFGEFGASEHARKMKIGRRVRDHKSS